MQSPFNRYLCTWCLITVGVLGTIAVTNAVIDPFVVYRLPLLPFNSFKNKIESRVAKAEILRHERYKGLVLGTSRSEMGFDPESFVWPVQSVANLGLVATNMYETQYVFRDALKQTSPKLVLLGCDFLTFSQTRTTQRGFYQSLFNPSRNLFEYHFDNLLSSYVTKNSFDVVKSWMKQRPSPYELTGFRRKKLTSRPYRSLANEAVKLFLTHPELYTTYRYSQSRLDVFREIVEACRERNIELVVVIPPIHSLQLELIRMTGLWPTFEHWKHDLVRIIEENTAKINPARTFPLWDFTGYEDYNTERFPPPEDPTPMRWYWETSHFKKELGDLVLHRVFGQHPPGGENIETFGTKLTSENIDSHLAKIGVDRQAYVKKHADEIEWVRTEAGKYIDVE